MQIPFEVEDRDVVFHWHSTLNRVELELDDGMVPVNTWWHPGQQFTLKNTRVWTHDLDGHEIRIEKVRPGLIGIGRANQITIRVDGEFVHREIGT